MSPSPLHVPARLTAVVALSLLAGCRDRSAPSAPTPPPPTAPAAAATPTAAPVDDVKIMTEYWEGTNQIKFRYELRKGTNGRYARNGFSQAFYLSGVVEREGHYRDNERIGVWKYFDTEGKLLRTEDRKDGKFPQGPLTTPPAQ
jgi:hypothetical protein